MTIAEPRPFAQPRPVAGDRRAKARALRMTLIIVLGLTMLMGLGWGAAGGTDVIGALFAKFGIGEVSRVGREAVGNHADFDIVAIRQSQMLFGGHVT